MAIRLRLKPHRGPGPEWEAMCAAESHPKHCDVYIDDGQHDALTEFYDAQVAIEQEAFGAGVKNLEKVADENRLIKAAQDCVEAWERSELRTRTDGGWSGLSTPMGDLRTALHAVGGYDGHMLRNDKYGASLRALDHWVALAREQDPQ